MPRCSPSTGPPSVSIHMDLPCRCAATSRRPTSAAAISPGAWGRQTYVSESSTATISRRSARSSMRARARSTSGSSGESGLVVVQLEDLDRAGRGRVDAEAAQHALVEVALHDVDAAVLVGVDVDRADLGQLGRDRCVADDLVVDLDADEGGVLPHADTLLSASLAFMI